MPVAWLRKKLNGGRGGSGYTRRAMCCRRTGCSGGDMFSEAIHHLVARNHQPTRKQRIPAPWQEMTEGWTQPAGLPAVGLESGACDGRACQRLGRTEHAMRTKVNRGVGCLASYGAHRQGKVSSRVIHGLWRWQEYDLPGAFFLRMHRYVRKILHLA